MFALSALGADELRVSLKCDPGLAEQLRDAYEAIGPGYHLNKRHWNTVVVDGVDRQLLMDMIEDSYDLVVEKLPRKTRNAARLERRSASPRAAAAAGAAAAPPRPPRSRPGSCAAPSQETRPRRSSASR